GRQPPRRSPRLRRRDSLRDLASGGARKTALSESRAARSVVAHSSDALSEKAVVRIVYKSIPRPAQPARYVYRAVSRHSSQTCTLAQRTFFLPAGPVAGWNQG